MQCEATSKPLKIDGLFIQQFYNVVNICLQVQCNLRLSPKLLSIRSFLTIGARRRATASSRSATERLSQKSLFRLSSLCPWAFTFLPTKAICRLLIGSRILLLDILVLSMWKFKTRWLSQSIFKFEKLKGHQTKISSWLFLIKKKKRIYAYLKIITILYINYLRSVEP